MEWKLELVVVPVADQDRAKAFYVDPWASTSSSTTGRARTSVIQASPPGSACAVALMANPGGGGDPAGTPPGGPGHRAGEGRRSPVAAWSPARSSTMSRAARWKGPTPPRQDYNTFFEFHDPDGNGWWSRRFPAGPDRAVGRRWYRPLCWAAAAIRAAALGCPPMDQPNILLIMTDEERYPPPYETRGRGVLPPSQLPARESLRSRGLELHRHYAGSTACTPSRATLFTGQYPSLHGVTSTDGTAKQANDPAMGWLDPNSVPTLGDWFRAGGYRTHYRGKWHISHADLMAPGPTRASWPPTTRAACPRGGGRLPPGRPARPVRLLGLDRPRAARGGQVRLRHRARRGLRRAGGRALRRPRRRPGRGTVAVRGVVRQPPRHRLLGLRLGAAAAASARPTTPSPTCPRRRRSPTRSPAARPARRRSRPCWPQMIYESAPTSATAGSTTTCTSWSTRRSGASWMPSRQRHGRRHHRGLHLGPRRPAGRPRRPRPEVVQRLRRGHPGARRGRRPGHPGRRPGVSVPTSHVDLVPTLLGLAGIDVEQAAAGVAAHHDEAQPLPGRDLSGSSAAVAPRRRWRSPIYFMTEDNVTSGADPGQPPHRGRPSTPVDPADQHRVGASPPCPPGRDGETSSGSSTTTTSASTTGTRRTGVPPNPFLGPAAEPLFELHNLTPDPEERHNLAADRARRPVAVSVLEASARPSACSRPCGTRPDRGVAPPGALRQGRVARRVILHRGGRTGSRQGDRRAPRRAGAEWSPVHVDPGRTVGGYRRLPR